MLNLANRLTLLRIVMSFVFMAVLFSQLAYACTLALCLFIVASLTDIWDGQIARRLHLESDFGKLMDPLADKILISTAFISFVQIPQTGVHAWMVVLIIAREFLITGFRLLALSTGTLVKASWWGKHKTVSQMVAISLILGFLSCKEILCCYPALWMRWQMSFEQCSSLLIAWTMVIVVALTLLSGFMYILENRLLLKAMMDGQADGDIEGR